MATNSQATFDIGPLSWVKAEIEHSLGEARKHLDKLAALPLDAKELKYILTHLHQVSGALSMVGLGAATRFNEEAEKLAASFEASPPVPGEDANRVLTLDVAMTQLSAYLDALLAGQPDQPMVLAKSYLALNQARGAHDASETDLFSPDLSLMMPDSDATVMLPRADLMGDTIKQWRSAYQAGLLKLLRDKDIEGGLRAMRAATVAIEALQVTSPSRAFWYAAVSFFDTLTASPADTGALAVQVLGKIDQQIKLLIEGVQRVPEKLFRELLLVIGRSTISTHRVKTTCEMYRLKELLALPAVGNAAAESEKTALALRGLRDQIAVQKDDWLKFTSGTRPAIEAFVTNSEASAAAAVLLGNKEISQLLHVVCAVGVHLKQSAQTASESLGLEVATALLYAETATENFAALGSDESQEQSAGLIARVKSAMSGAPLAAFDSKSNPLMDEMSKRAQEKMLMHQVGHEMQANLQIIESTLDGFFRDAAKIEPLKTLPPLFSQVQGALLMLEFEEAAKLNRSLQDGVAQFASGAVPGTGEAANTIADGVSGLGLYVAALQQGTPNPRSALLPALIRAGIASAPAPAPAPAAVRAEPVTAADVDVQKQKVQMLYEEWKQSPAEPGPRAQLREAVQELKLDAEIVADSHAARQSEEALKAIDATLDPTLARVSGAIGNIAPDKQPEAPAAATVQLMDTTSDKIDDELLEIFLEEATEVVATIRENAAVLVKSPSDREALSTIRRAYHTLKGSGRMVGLMDIGDVAWNCEQVFNKALKDETPASPGLQQFIGVTADAFGGWVASLQNTGTAQVDGADIARAAEMLKSGRDPEFAPAAIVSVEPIAITVAIKTIAPAVVAGAALVAAAAPEVPVAVPAPAPPAAPAVEQDVVFGTNVVPAQLFGIYLGEAESHVVTLDAEMFAIESNPNGAISHEFMRAAHTLNSSSLTTGFTMIADVASALEKWSHAAIASPPTWTPKRLAVTREAVDAIGAMVLGLQARDVPVARPDVVSALTILREEFDAEKLSTDSDTTLDNAAQAPAFAAPSADAELPPPIPAAPSVAAHVSTPPPIPSETPPPLPSTEAAPVAPAIPAAAIMAAGALVASAAGFAVAKADPVAGAAHFAPETAPTPAPSIAPPKSAAAAEPAAGGEMGRDRRGVNDDVDVDLLPIFLEEAREITPHVGDALRAWRADPTNHAPVSDLARHLHTLKGSSRMAGLMRLGELAHVLETRVIDMDREATPSAKAFDAVDDGLDRFNVAIERYAAGDLAAPVEIPVLADISSLLPAPLAKMAAARAEIAAEGEKLEGRERQALLRVNADLVDRFVNEAGELAIARSRIDLEIQAFKRGLLELNDNVARMRAQLREIEIQAESQIQSRTKEQEETGAHFDPLEFDRFSRTQELTRFLAESLNDVVTLQQSLQKNLDESDAALAQQARLTSDLQQGLMGVRLVPLGNLQDRFYRVVRQTAKEIEKKANLEFRGVRVEMDRSVLEKITAPLEHLLRNAVAHGLETPAARTAKGKPEIGEITIDAQQIGNEVILTLSDDGAGLNFARIREKALQQGLISADEIVNDTQLSQLIFMAGFTTAEKVTQIAGRGVGMDVVRNEIVALGGRVDISTQPGRGTTFTIALPLTLAVTQAVMVVVGEAMYAIPAVMIEQVQEYNGKRYEPLLAMSEITWKDNLYPLRSMEALLGGKPTASALNKASVMLVKSGQQRAAIQVDEIIGNREIVVKTIGPQLSRIAGVTGATVLGSGQIVLIMNPVQLVYPEVATITLEAAPTPSALAPGAVPEAAPAEVPTLTPASQSLAQTIAANAPQAPVGGVAAARTTRLVMVVDDSLTVRKITTRMLTREGFEVATAKDGVDGLQQLDDLTPDLILLDIEMPRMDGFEFARNLRADARPDGRIRNIPIIMITSRTADKHRNRAMELGVNEYMGKPYQEEQLLTLIRQHTGLSAKAH